MSTGTLRHWLVLAASVAGLTVAAPSSAAPDTSAAPDCDVVPLVADEASASVVAGLGRQTVAIPAPSALPASRHRVEARLDPQRHTITARDTLAWTNPGPATLCSLYLHLDLNAWSGWGSRHMADVSGRSDVPDIGRGEWAAQRLTHLRQDGRAAVWRTVPPPAGPLADRTLIRVDLPEPIPPGGRTTLDIGVAARLPGAWTGFGHADRFHLATHWIPQVARLDTGAGGPRWVAPAFDPAGHPARGDQSFDVWLTVPTRYVPVAASRAVGPAQRNGRWITYRFHHEGQDFAWAAAPRLAGPDELRVLTIGAQPVAGIEAAAAPNAVRLRVFHSGNNAAAATAAEAIADALGGYARVLSPPAQNRLTAVLVPFDPAPEALTLARDGLIVLPAHATEAELERAALRAVGAGWFAGTEAADPRARTLSLGALEYWTVRLLRERGRTLPPTGWLRWLRLRDDMDPFEALRAPLDLGVPAIDDDLRARRVALALHDLEGRIGRGALDRGFRAWLRQGSRSPAALRAALAVASGRPREVHRSFAQHIAREMTVDDRLVSLASEEVLPRPGLVEFRGRQVELTQAAIDRAVARRRAEWRRGGGRSGHGPFAWRSTAVVQRRGAIVPQAVRVTFADGSWRRVRFDGREPVRRFEWIARSPAVSVQLDPSRAVLLDASKLDDGRSLQASVAPARRWGGDAAAVVQVASALLVGL